MKRKSIIYILGLVIVIAGGYFLFFQPEEKKGTYMEQTTEESSNSSYSYSSNDTTVENEQQKEDDAEVPIYLKDKKVKIEELREEQQLAVRFMIDFMNTGKKETEEEYFARLQPYFEEQDAKTIERFTQVMGIDDRYLPPFEPDRKLDKIYVAGTFERENSYIVFVRTVEGEKEIDIPLQIRIEKSESGDKKPSYVSGFNDAKRGLIRLFSNTDYVKEKK